MALEINHETNDIVNSTGEIKVNGTAVGGDNSPVTIIGSRGIIGGGIGSSGHQNVIQYITIATTGNSQDFADLTTGTGQLAGLHGTGRGVFGGGTNSKTNVMQYITVSTLSNAADFGDLNQPLFNLCACSNGSRGIFAGGDA